MAYSTGTAADPAALLTVIENFAVTNGYTLSAGTGSWLSKGSSNIMLSNYQHTYITSINSSGTSTGTATTSSAHNLVTGDLVTIIGSTDPLYNVSLTAVTVTNSTTFTYPLAGIPAAASVLTPGCQRTVFSFRNASSDRLYILGNTGTSSGVGICPRYRAIHIHTSYWPITYKLYYNSTPDQIVCVIQYNVDWIQVIIFEDLVRIHNSAYTGGNWFFATKGGGDETFNTSYVAALASATDTSITCGHNDSNGYLYLYNCIPFTTEFITPYGTSAGEGIYLGIDGLGWHVYNPNSTPNIQYTDYTKSLIYRSPNSWNQQTNLVPIHLDLVTAASTPYRHYLGYSEHLRLIRVDNYEIGDSITIGSDVWNIFPWHKKNSSNRNGLHGSTALGTGTYGFAVRKT